MSLTEDHLVRVLLHEQAKLCGLVRLIVRDAAAVEDIFQEVSLKAVANRSHFTGEAHARNWLRTVARNEAMNWAKRTFRSPLVFDDRVLDQIESEFQHLDESSSSDVVEALEHCLDRLTPYSAKIIRLRYVEGLTGTRLSGAAGRGHEATYKALGRAHRSLAQCIGERLGQEGGES